LDNVGKLLLNLKDISSDRIPSRFIVSIDATVSQGWSKTGPIPLRIILALSIGLHLHLHFDPLRGKATLSTIKANLQYFGNGSKAHSVEKQLHSGDYFLLFRAKITENRICTLAEIS
jgi:hypothetical protein